MFSIVPVISLVNFFVSEFIVLVVLVIFVATASAADAAVNAIVRCLPGC